MKRAAISALIVVCLLSFGFWTGRASTAFTLSDSQLLDEMNQALKQAAQAKEILFLREMVRRELAEKVTPEPVRQYSGPPCVAAD